MLMMMLIILLLLLLLLMMMMMMMQSYYSAVTPGYCSMIGALGRAVSFETCYQWALLSGQITIPYYFILLYKSTFILLSVKCMLGLFVFP